jgi:hypothetical protein
MHLTITVSDPLPEHLVARTVMTLETSLGAARSETPFVISDEHTLTCYVVPLKPGLHSFRAEFSLDGGVTWLEDTVPHAWLLVDPAQVDGTRLYTLIPTISGSVADWTADLKRIKAMNFDSVHLLPVTTQDASQSPYSAKDLFDVDPGYLNEGSKEEGLSQLEAFVQEAKRLGLRLCFDLVLNHVGVTSTMALRAPDWIIPDQTRPDGLQRARYWSEQGWRYWNDLVLINYEHPSDSARKEIWTYMIEYALFWAKYASDTGGIVRFDNLHGSTPEFIEALTAALRAEYPAVAVLAEYFTDEQTLLKTVPAWSLNLLLATPWGYKFVPDLRDYLKFMHRVSKQIRYYMPVTSHDSGSPGQEFGKIESVIPRYVAAALLGTGATGIVQGVEYGEPEKIEFIGCHSMKHFPAEARFGEFITRVNSILAEHSTFRHGENCRFVDNEHHAIIAAFQADSGPDLFGFLVVCNFDTNNQQSITIDLAPVLGADGPIDCEELLSLEDRSFPTPRLDINLPPCSAQVLKFPRTLP